MPASPRHVQIILSEAVDRFATPMAPRFEPRAIVGVKQSNCLFDRNKWRDMLRPYSGSAEVLHGRLGSGFHEGMDPFAKTANTSGASHGIRELFSVA